jgi:hypothetical protein
MNYDNGICDQCESPLDSRGLCRLCNADIYDFSHEYLEQLRKDNMKNIIEKRQILCQEMRDGKMTAFVKEIDAIVLEEFDQYGIKAFCNIPDDDEMTVITESESGKALIYGDDIENIKERLHELLSTPEGIKKLNNQLNDHFDRKRWKNWDVHKLNQDHE